MKKQWLPLVFAIFIALAPVVRADDGAAPSVVSQLIAQLVALFVGDETDLGELSPPFGAADPGDQAELGDLIPPFG